MNALLYVLLVSFVAMLVLNVPISVALVLAAALAMLANPAGPLDLAQIAVQLCETTNSFPLLAIPFFILAGSIMSRGGMSDRLIDLARAWWGGCPAAWRL